MKDKPLALSPSAGTEIGRKGFSLWGVILTLIDVVAILLALALVGYEYFYMARIYPGVSVFGTDLDGLALDEAEIVLQQRFQDYQPIKLILRYMRPKIQAATGLPCTKDHNITGITKWKRTFRLLWQTQVFFITFLSEMPI